MTRLWIRTDGSLEIGLGHLMRTWAVAEAAETLAIPVTYATVDNPTSSALLRQLGADSHRLADPGDKSWQQEVDEEDVVLFDGYAFGADDYSSVRDRCSKVAVIDDFGSGAYPVDLVVSPATRDTRNYEVLRGTQFLLGPRYALIRSEFLAERTHSSPEQEPTLIITMGGSDPHGATSRVSRVIQGQDAFERVIYIQGPVQGPIEIPGQGLAVVKNPEDLPRLFGSATAAISAAGNTAWELLALGVPTILIQTANNQRAIGHLVAERRAGLFLGEIEQAVESLPETLSKISDPGVRNLLRKNALTTVDGQGAVRVMRRLLE